MSQVAILGDMALPTPVLTGDVHVAPTDRLYDDLAGALMAAAIAAIKDRGVFHLALSGGSTPEPFYIRLMIDPRYRAIPWSVTHLWLVDERRVPLDDEQSNWRAMRETIVDQAPMRKRFLHPMPVLSPEAANEYEREMREVFDLTVTSAIPRLDFVLLGVGNDGHTASLFPGSPALVERQHLIAANDGPTVTPPPRLTMTLPLLNKARKIAVLVTGDKKAEMIRRVEAQCRTGKPDPQRLPITGVIPEAGEEVLTWYLDDAAAGREPASWREPDLK